MLLLFGESSYLSRNFWISLFRAFFSSVLSFNCTQPKVIYPRFLYWNVPFLPRQIVKNGKMFLDCIFNRKMWYSLSIWKLCKGLVRFFIVIFRLLASSVNPRYSKLSLVRVPSIWWRFALANSSGNENKLN